MRLSSTGRMRAIGIICSSAVLPVAIGALIPAARVPLLDRDAGRRRAGGQYQARQSPPYASVINRGLSAGWKADTDGRTIRPGRLDLDRSHWRSPARARPLGQSHCPERGRRPVHPIKRSKINGSSSSATPAPWSVTRTTRDRPASSPMRIVRPRGEYAIALLTTLRGARDLAAVDDGGDLPARLDRRRHVSLAKDLHSRRRSRARGRQGRRTRGCVEEARPRPGSLAELADQAREGGAPFGPSLAGSHLPTNAIDHGLRLGLGTVAASRGRAPSLAARPNASERSSRSAMPLNAMASSADSASSPPLARTVKSPCPAAGCAATSRRRQPVRDGATAPSVATTATMPVISGAR